MKLHFKSPLFKTIVAAPHRLGFLAGAALLLMSFLLWTLEMSSRSFSIDLSPSMPALFWHGSVMVYGFFPLFMLGFIYTAGPRWLNVASPALRQYAPVMLGYAAGTVLCLAGRWGATWMLLGVALQGLAWSRATQIWWLAIARSQVGDKTHAQAIGWAFVLGLAGLLAQLVWLLFGNIAAWQLAVNLGIWGLLLPVFLSVSHRMIPFFSANVLQPYTAWRPAWLLYTLVGLSMLRPVFEAMGVNTLPVDLPLAAILLYTSWRWQLWHSFKVKLLAMLHAAFAWAGVALALQSISDLLQLFQLSGHAGLGFAPLHALTLGFFCTMLLGFVTRVTLGHSGRPLVAAGIAWTAYWAMHGVALARVLGELIPAWQMALYLIAAVLALLALLLWGRVYMPMYWQARVDGQQG
ncbi:NnrS family protein [Chitinibacter sp. S2-10]|uniref:NnrS family protein n=1 Tax=Chitinibacter sp. S2-10 TaxID=3373597 RepID=UPI0039779651